MQRGFLLCLLFCWASTVTLATTAGNSEAATQYFDASQINSEYQDAAATRRPTSSDWAIEVTGHWRFFLQVYRAIDHSPSLRKAFTQHRPSFLVGGYESNHRELRQYFAERGVTTRDIARQSTAVYTLQLVAFQRKDSLQRFLSGLPYRRDGRYSPGTKIYRSILKNFRLGYGDESLRYKEDPLYLLTKGRFTRIRYGIYENTADAQHDAKEWARRYHLRALVTRVPFTPALTRRVLWGDLPGIYMNRQYIHG